MRLDLLVSDDKGSYLITPCNVSTVNRIERTSKKLYPYQIRFKEGEYYTTLRYHDEDKRDKEYNKIVKGIKE